MMCLCVRLLGKIHDVQFLSFFFNFAFRNSKRRSKIECLRYNLNFGYQNSLSSTPSPHITRILVFEKDRAMLKPCQLKHLICIQHIKYICCIQYVPTDHKNNTIIFLFSDKSKSQSIRPVVICGDNMPSRFEQGQLICQILGGQWPPWPPRFRHHCL